MDATVGTSGGAIVGAWYGTGLELMTDEEIRHPAPHRSQSDMRLGGVASLLGSLNLDNLFRSYPNYSDVDVQDKERQRKFPFGPVGGIKDQDISLTDGVVPGQAVELLFNRLFRDFPTDFLYEDPDAAPFDRLPTPFRSVAVQPQGYDLRQWQKLVLGGKRSLPLTPRYRVSLTDAVRASIAIPYVFTPRYLPPNSDTEGYRYKLVDGGTRDNYPTDVACDAFDPDVIIGLNIPVDLKPLSEFFTLTGHPKLDPRIQEESNLFKLGRDPAKRPDPFDIPMFTGSASPDRFDDWRHLAWLGYLSMEKFAKGAQGKRLLSYALSYTDYLDYRQGRRRKLALARSSRRVTPPKGRKLNSFAAKAGFGSLGASAGIGEYSSIPQERYFGPTQIFANFMAEGGTAQPNLASVTARIEEFQVGNSLSSLFGEIESGSLSRQELSYNFVPDQGSYFLRPFLKAEAMPQFVYDRGRRSDLQVRHDAAGIEIGILKSSAARLSIASEAGSVSGSANRRDFINTVRAELDTTDSELQPHKGLRANVFLRNLQLERPRDSLFQAGGFAEWHVVQGGVNQFFLQAGGGSSFGARPAPELGFRLGGLGLMQGYPQDYLRGGGFAYAGAGYLKRLARLPFYLGELHWVAEGEAANVDGPTYADVTTGLRLTSRFADISFGVSAARGFRPRLTLLIGRGSAAVPRLMGYTD